MRDADERINKQLAAQEQAWQELQLEQDLANAEARLRIEAQPKEDEPRQVVSGGDFAARCRQAAGSAQPAAGGPQPPASAAVGGPMGKRHGGGGGPRNTTSA